VEVDGGCHIGQEGRDARRTAWLERWKRCVVIRFTNEQVLTSIGAVLEAIGEYGPLSNNRHIVTDNTRIQEYRDRIPYRPTKCKQCGKVPMETRIVTYVNGTNHRRWWCGGCQVRVGGNPIPSKLTDDKLIEMFGLEALAS
jgi:hypothetical protein